MVILKPSLTPLFPHTHVTGRLTTANRLALCPSPTSLASVRTSGDSVDVSTSGWRSGQACLSDRCSPRSRILFPIELQSGVVYRIPCSCGKAYIGETTRRLETIRKEHRDDCHKQNLQSCTVADHAWTAHCPIKWEETTIVDRARTPCEVQVKEALQIQNLPMDILLNRDRGLEIVCLFVYLKR